MTMDMGRTAVYTREPWPVVQRRRGKRHAVIASGGPEDGSLYGMYTFCNLLIRDLEKFTEVPGAEPTCRRCVDRVRRAAERDRTA